MIDKERKLLNEIIVMQCRAKTHNAHIVYPDSNGWIPHCLLGFQRFDSNVICLSFCWKVHASTTSQRNAAYWGSCPVSDEKHSKWKCLMMKLKTEPAHKQTSIRLYWR